MKNQRYLTQNDAALLSKLAEHLLRLGETEFNAGEEIVDMIATSTIFPADVQRKDCVSLYSTVTYATLNSDDQRSITIVAPQDANPQLARISALTPIGLALIGRKVTHIATVTLPSNRIEKLKILAVVPHEATEQAAS